MTPDSTPFASISAFFLQDPVLRSAQVGLGALAALLLFLLLFTLRDILPRTHSLLLQAFCIVLVALLPVVGFLLYLLIRPSRTLHERAMEDVLLEVHAAMHPTPAVQPAPEPTPPPSAQASSDSTPTPTLP